MDCFGTYFTHAQTCDNVCVQSATQWTASVHTLVTHAQTCDNVRVQSATQWIALVHTLHMPKPVITFVFKVLRNGLLRYILYTCPCYTWTALIFETFDLLEHVCIFWHQFWNIYAMASFSGMCTHGRCYAVFTWLNLPARSRVHVRHQYVCPRADMVDATPYSIDWKFQSQKRSYAINMFAHVQTWSMLRHVHLIEQWKLLFNNENCKCQDAQKKSYKKLWNHRC